MRIAHCNAAAVNCLDRWRAVPTRTLKNRENCRVQGQKMRRLRPKRVAQLAVPRQTHPRKLYSIIRHDCSQRADAQHVWSKSGMHRKVHTCVSACTSVPAGCCWRTEIQHVLLWKKKQKQKQKIEKNERTSKQACLERQKFHLPGSLAVFRMLHVLRSGCSLAPEGIFHSTDWMQEIPQSRDQIYPFWVKRINVLNILILFFFFQNEGNKNRCFWLLKTTETFIVSVAVITA